MILHSLETNGVGVDKPGSNTCVVVMVVISE